MKTLMNFEIDTMKADINVIQEESIKLKTLFDEFIALEKKRGRKISQRSFGEKHGWTQAAVNNFLKGRTALNANSASIFAKELNCPVSSFSERLDILIKRQATSSGILDKGLLNLMEVDIYNDENLDLLLNYSIKEGMMATAIRKEVISGEVDANVLGYNLIDDSMGESSKNSDFIIDLDRKPSPTNTVLIRLNTGKYEIRKLKVNSYDEHMAPNEWEAFPTNEHYPTITHENGIIVGVAIKELKKLIV